MYSAANAAIIRKRHKFCFLHQNSFCTKVTMKNATHLMVIQNTTAPRRLKPVSFCRQKSISISHEERTHTRTMVGSRSMFKFVAMIARLKAMLICIQSSGKERWGSHE
jgi:hypothetical protein